jgi:DNA-binding transcriptional LysR family regulator
MLDFRLRVFYTVAKILNFTKAAVALDVTQPAVTKHIKELELSYKVTLFDRQPNALALTEAGKILYKHAATIMEQYELLAFDINTLTQNLAGDLRIGMGTPMGQYILPPFLALFGERFPNIALQVINEGAASLMPALLNKDIDIVLTGDKTGGTDIDILPYLEDEIVLCSRKAAVNKQFITVEELARLPLVLSEEDAEINNIIKAALAKNGLSMEKLNIKLRLNSMESVKAYLLYSDCFSFLPKCAVKNELASNSLQINQINKVEIITQYNIAIRQGQRPPIVDTFLQLMRITADNNL